VRAPPLASSDASHSSPPAHTKSRVSYTSWLTGVPAGRACLVKRRALRSRPRLCSGAPPPACLRPHVSPTLLISRPRTEANTSHVPLLRSGRA